MVSNINVPSDGRVAVYYPDFSWQGLRRCRGFSDEPCPVFSRTTLWWDFNPLTTPPLGLKPFWCQCPRLTCLRIIESAGYTSCSRLTCWWFRGHYGEVRAWHLHRETIQSSTQTLGLNLTLPCLSLPVSSLCSYLHPIFISFSWSRKWCVLAHRSGTHSMRYFLRQCFQIKVVLNSNCVFFFCICSYFVGKTFFQLSMPFLCLGISLLSLSLFQSFLLVHRPNPHPPLLTHPSVSLRVRNPVHLLGPALSRGLINLLKSQSAFHSITITPYPVWYSLLSARGH